jgi:excisionase family DNA binding protein
MLTLDASAVPSSDLDALDQLATDLPDESPLRDFLEGVVACVRAGEALTVVAERQQMTPAAAAKMLGVSRVHVYKLMDLGDLPFTRVGNDRRTTMADVMALLNAQEGARSESARRAGHPSEPRTKAFQSMLES